MNLLILLAFPILWLGILLAVFILRGGNFTSLNKSVLFLYAAFMAMLGPLGEIIVGTLYEAVAGQPLWQYKVYPTHSGYTSYYAPAIWSISGVYLYYVHEELKLFKQKSKWIQAASQTFETILVEVALNVSFWIISGSLIFYYLPSDLFHVTSLQTLPFYFILSMVVMKSIKRFKVDPAFYSLMCLSLMFVLVFMTS